MTVRWSQAAQGHRVLDACCGSGDLAFLLSRSVGPNGSVVGLDFAAEMLSIASRRHKDKVDAGQQRMSPIEWVQGDVLQLPFADGEFDAATVGYGLRNVVDRARAMAELRRVLKPGARVSVLDFNHSPHDLVDSMQSFLLSHVVVPVARLYQLEEEYKYIQRSIRSFPMGPELEDMARAAGFKRAKHYPIGFGMMGVLVAQA